MDVVRSEEVFPDRAVGVREVRPQVEHLHLGIAVELQRIEGGVGLRLKPFDASVMLSPTSKTSAGP